MTLVSERTLEGACEQWRPMTGMGTAQLPHTANNPKGQRSFDPGSMLPQSFPGSAAGEPFDVASNSGPRQWQRPRHFQEVRCGRLR